MKVNLETGLKYCPKCKRELTLDNFYPEKGTSDDHKIPLSYFDLTIEENLYTAWNYRNLQPLWGGDNLKKSDLVPENMEQLVEQLKKEINDNN